MSKKNNIDDLKVLSHLLDSRFRGPGGIRFGLDSLLGLVPFVGDTLTSIISGYLLYRAATLGAPKIVLVKMYLNILLDHIIGTVPILGDLFDVVWKSNSKNYTLLCHYLEKPYQTTANSWMTLFMLLIALLLLVSLPVVVMLLVGQL